MSSPPQQNVILMYHGVSDDRRRRFRQFVVSPQSFEEQMAYLAQQSYRGCSVSELVDARSQRTPLEPNMIALTFDDAFQELVPNAVPVLRRFGFSATIYVPTAYVGASSRWLAGIGEGDRPILDVQQLRELAATGIECGAHSHTHPQLDVLPPHALRSEVEQSKQLLEELLEARVQTFAYPYGYERPVVREAIAAAGFRSACRVNYAPSPIDEDVYALSRLPVLGGWDIDSFAALVEGRLSLLARRSLARGWRPVRRGLARLAGNTRSTRL